MKHSVLIFACVVGFAAGGYAQEPASPAKALLDRLQRVEQFLRTQRRMTCDHHVQKIG